MERAFHEIELEAARCGPIPEELVRAEIVGDVDFGVEVAVKVLSSDREPPALLQRRRQSIGRFRALDGSVRADRVRSTTEEADPAAVVRGGERIRQVDAPCPS